MGVRRLTRANSLGISNRRKNIYPGRAGQKGRTDFPTIHSEEERLYG